MARVVPDLEARAAHHCGHLGAQLLSPSTVILALATSPLVMFAAFSICILIAGLLPVRACSGRAPERHVEVVFAGVSGSDPRLLSALPRARSCAPLSPWRFRVSRLRRRRLPAWRLGLPRLGLVLSGRRFVFASRLSSVSTLTLWPACLR